MKHGVSHDKTPGAGQNGAIMQRQQLTLYPAELTRFLAEQNKCLIDPVSLPIDESLFPHEPIWITHAKRQPAAPVPPWTLKQVLMPWTRQPLTPAQRLERKLQD